MHVNVFINDQLNWFKHIESICSVSDFNNCLFARRQMMID